MFLTKKGLLKSLIMAICYFALGSFCISSGLVFSWLESDSKLFFILGAFCYVACPVVALWGFYAESKGKVIRSGNKLVRNELKPYEFIKKYQQLRNSTDTVINKPSVEVLQLVALAYDFLGDRENSLAVADEMIAVASDKKKMYAKLIKCSLLFSYGMVDEAEAIFSEARSSKLNFVCQALVDSIYKSDRAMAMGDYKTVEAYCQARLLQGFPKLAPVSKLVVHYQLGEAYEKMKDSEKAIFYYRYCVENAGETSILGSAQAALERLQ